MAVSWTPHRFSGGALALDVANTVVLRGDPNSFDRFADWAELPRFAKAATVQRASELNGRTLTVDDPERAAPVILSIREATDRLFRSTVMAGEIDSGDLSRFLSACAAGLAEASISIATGPSTGQADGSPLPLEAALSVSALSLLPQPRASRVRICANCRWLFLDHSRNRSRIWCDMAVCGNRQKAKRHYQRRKTETEAHHA